MIRTHSTCKYCPYSTKRKVWSDSPPNAKLLLLGEAPGADEEALGKVFSGASGRLLNWAISQVGLYRPSLWITNVINCRPQKNDISTLEASDAIVACQPGLRQELEAAVAGGVTTILALGATAIKALGIHGAVEKIRGSVYEWKSKSGKIIHVVPTYHPAAIMRQQWKRSGGGTADAGVLWLADFRKAKSISEDGWVTLQEHFNLKPTVTDVEHFVDTALKSNALIAVDTETTGLSLDYAKIVVIGLASGPEDAISVPFLDKDGFNYWTPTEQERVVSSLKRLFSTCDQVYQNSFFDVPLLRRHGFPVPWEKISHDTLLLSHTLAAESKHDLGSIVSLYGKTPYWKEEFKNRTVSILKMDQLEMRRYNLRDSVVLHQVLPPMLDELRTLNLVDFYHDEVQPLIAPIMEMLEEGVGFTPSRVATFKRDLEARLAKIDTQLRTDMNLPDSFNLNSDDHLRWFLFGHEPTVFKHLVDLPKKKPGTKIYAELVDIQALKDRGGPIYILAGWHPPSTASGKPSVDAEGLLSFRIQLNNRLQAIKNDEEKSKISKLLSWLDVLDEHTKLTKLLTTYTKYEPMKDGRIHPRWIAHGTVSGRLACREPNLMNVPKPTDDPNDFGTRVRGFFTAKPGHKMISCDYVNLEAQLLAFETEDPILCEVFERGLNLHDINTRSMFKISKEDSKWKPARKAAKVFFFGGIAYGGGDLTIYKKVYNEAPDLQLTFADFKKAKDSWMREHPHYVQWKERVLQEVMTKRQLRTEFGRLRQFLGNDKDIGKEALDYKIQSAGASLVNRAMARIYAERNRLGLKARFILQVHDQLVMECPLDEVEVVKSLMVREMEKPFQFKGKTRHIPVECSTGDNFGEL